MQEAEMFVLLTPRNVSIPLRPWSPCMELTRMEQLGSIAKVKEPTPLCSGMVVVAKHQEI